jgi:hypothetical protein
MLRRVVVCSLSAFATLLVTPALADADGGWGGTDCSQTSLPGCDITAGSTGSRPQPENPGAHGSSNAGNSDRPKCRYIKVHYSDPAKAPPTGPGAWFMVLCSPDGKDPWTHGPVWISAARPTLSPEQVAEAARKRLNLGKPIIASSPSRVQLVGLPTWLWLRNSHWPPVHATASVPGVSVTATARPTRVTWTMGDGRTAVCAGPGTPYPAGGDPRAASPTCGHIYSRSSLGEPGDSYVVSAKIHWMVTWAGAGRSGSFPELITMATTSFQVAESQAIAVG